MLFSMLKTMVVYF